MMRKKPFTAVDMNPVELAVWRVTPPARRAAIGYFYFRWIKSWLYRGGRVACPCCGGRYRKFIPFRANRAQIVEGLLCPGCLSFPRHRLLWLYLRDRTDIFQAPQRLLHIAPEYFLQKLFRRYRHLDYVSADLASPYAMVRMDLTAAAFQDGCFDAVICNHVLEHVGDDCRAIREIRRVLKPGGWAILQSPVDPGRSETFEDPTVTSPEERERLFGQHDHVRVYGRDYPVRLGEAGFDVTVDRFVETIEPSDIRRYGLDRDEWIFRCRRSGD